MIPTLPLALRNRLAEVILGALHDPEARRVLGELARQPDTAGWLGPSERQWSGPLGERARSASAAIDALPVVEPGGDLSGTLDAAAALFDGGLYFEVHEVLEPHWVAATGDTREALQGLIQVAVGWQHLANGNAAGARSLFVEGSARVHAGRLAGVSLDDFARAAAVAAEGLATGATPAAPRFPRRSPPSGAEHDQG